MRARQFCCVILCGCLHPPHLTCLLLEHYLKASQFVSFLLYVLGDWALDPGLLRLGVFVILGSLSRSGSFNSSDRQGHDSCSASTSDWGLPCYWASRTRGDWAGSNSCWEQVVTQDNILFSGFDSVVSPPLSMVSFYCKPVHYFQFYSLSISI